MANKRYYYAQLDADNICIGVSGLSGPITADNVVQLDTYDTSVQGKLWTGSEWVENPNPPTPPEPSTEPTNADIMAQLQAMQGDQVPQSTLDEAYTEGVNAYV